MNSPKFFRTIGILIGIASITYLLLFNRPDANTALQTAVLPEVTETETKTDEYGIPISGMDIENWQIRKNQTFNQILAENNIPTEKITLLVERAQAVFNLRQLNIGNQFRFYHRSGVPRFIVYQENPSQFIVFDLETLEVRTGQHPVEIKRRTVTGTINSSLFATLDDQGIQPEIADQLSRIYAWQIDFFRLHKGDNFNLIYEEELVNGVPIAIKNILAARFYHGGEDFYAFRFEQDGTVDYFDEQGKGLRKAMLMSPLEFGRLTSGFSLHRFHPVQKRYKAHLGTDYAAPTGTPIHAVGDGVVIEATFKRNNGNYVKIRHNQTYTTAYLHMSKIAKGIKPGTRVKQNDVIGFVGSTGLATGPHVCYRLWKNGTQIDSKKEKFPPAEPIQQNYRTDFDSLRTALFPVLQKNGVIPFLARQGLSVSEEIL